MRHGRDHLPRADLVLMLSLGWMLLTVIVPEIADDARLDDHLLLHGGRR